MFGSLCDVLEEVLEEDDESELESVICDESEVEDTDDDDVSSSSYSS